MLRNGVGWFSLGRRVQPSAQCRIGLLPGCAKPWGIKADTSRAGGPRAERAHPRLSAEVHGQVGRSAPEGEETFWSPQPPAMSRALRSSTLRGCLVGAFIVSRSESFINSCTNTILERVMACGSDSAITSGTLLPLFASS
jgi:hypothetical protein